MSAEDRCQPTIQCPCDGSTRIRAYTYDTPPEGETAFDWSGQDYFRAYDRCMACGHWFANHALDLGSLYEGEYVQNTYGRSLSSTFDRITALPARESDNAGRCARILAFAEKQLTDIRAPALLDVGSGLGVFPYSMSKSGWNVTALDPDPTACAHIAERVGVPVITANFLDLDLAKLIPFDVVTLNKVIEHVNDPCSMLRQAALIVQANGFVYVEVPDGESAAEIGQTREEFFVEHHHVFSLGSLSVTVERAGLRIVRVDRIVEPSGKFTLACFAVVPT